MCRYNATGNYHDFPPCTSVHSLENDHVLIHGNKSYETSMSSCYGALLYFSRTLLAANYHGAFNEDGISMSLRRSPRYAGPGVDLRPILISPGVDGSLAYGTIS